jgi:hypothetical protein
VVGDVGKIIEEFTFPSWLRFVLRRRYLKEEWHRRPAVQGGNELQKVPFGAKQADFGAIDGKQLADLGAELFQAAGFSELHVLEGFHDYLPAYLLMMLEDAVWGNPPKVTRGYNERP